MKFFDDIGTVAIGTRIRFLAEVIGADAAKIYEHYGNDLHPKWFPAFQMLSGCEDSTVTAIADYIGHSHASVSKIIKEMAAAGLIKEVSNKADRRSTKVALSAKGRKLAEKIQDQLDDVRSAVEELSSEASNNLWAALGEWEYLLSKKSFLERVLSQRKERSSVGVKIEPYQPKYREAFKALNEEWLTKYFVIEETDRIALGNPKKKILDPGGFIFVATIEGDPVGVCALIKREDLKCFELAKMAVSPKAQGKGIGQLLMQAAVDKARALGETKLYLESNTVLKPAIALYEKFGFKKIVGPPSPYARANIQMEMALV